VLRQVAVDIQAGIPASSAQRLQVGRLTVAREVLDVVPGQRRAPAVEDRDRVSAGAQGLHKMAADEARAAEDEDLHAASIRNLAVARL
jgi:hypothetical protein